MQVASVWNYTFKDDYNRKEGNIYLMKHILFTVMWHRTNGKEPAAATWDTLSN